MYPVCHYRVESVGHILFLCSFASDIRTCIIAWWGLSGVSLLSYEDWIGWLSSLKLRKDFKEFMEATFYVSCWNNWTFRNKTIFQNKNLKKAMVFDNILQQDSPTEETKTESNVWDDGSEDVNPFGGGNPLLTKETESKPIIWDIRDEEEEYPFVNKYPSFKEEPIMFVKDESCPVYDTDNEEEESMPVYDTDIEDVIEEEEGFVRKGGSNEEEEDGVKDEVVYADHINQIRRANPIDNNVDISKAGMKDTYLTKRFLTGNMLSGDIPNTLLIEGATIDLSYNNFTWKRPDRPTCRPHMNLFLNLFKSSLSGNPLQDILPCTKDAKCPRYGCSLHVNSGGSKLRYTDDTTYRNLGRRIFNIYIQGKLVKKDFNIEDEVGIGRPLVVPFNASVVNHTLEVRCSIGGKKKTVAYAGFAMMGLRVEMIISIAVWWKLNFNATSKIGEGRFKPVYKGTLRDGTIIAVKQLSSRSRQGNREFLNEIGPISCLQYQNLVKLHGCCIEGDQLLLIYEYMENNSLASALFDSNKIRTLLDWVTRFRICVVHRDIKTTNVLLDKDLKPKISYFGLARLDKNEEKLENNGEEGSSMPSGSKLKSV
ncbi:probable LRR receptor-like serine/threonine-protein kinase RFK1 isoform X2 [Tanacetum coccineum]